MCLPNIGNSDTISLGITSQWDTGFCGRWIKKCPSNREISFIIPENLRETRAWNINNMEKIGNKIVGNCPYWTSIGQDTQGGFCAIFDIGNRVVIGNNGFFLSNKLRNLGTGMLSSGLNLDTYYQNVSIEMNVKNINSIEYNMIENDINLNSYGSYITILDNKLNDDGSADLSMIVECTNRIEFDGALFLQKDSMKNLEIDPNLFYIDPVCNEEQIFENSGNRINNLKFLNLFLIFIILKI